MNKTNSDSNVQIFYRKNILGFYSFYLIPRFKQMHENSQIYGNNAAFIWSHKNKKKIRRRIVSLKF